MDHQIAGRTIDGRFLPFCALSPNASYANPSGTGCVDCVSQHGFDFTDLQTIAQGIARSCPTDPRLATTTAAGTVITPAVLTPLACTLIAGASWTLYPRADIWNRLATWKFPLYQLAVQFPRPPLSWWIEAFVIFRLLGNPVGTYQDLLLKFASCQCRALYWKEQFARPTILLGTDAEQEGFEYYERLWKAFAIIIDSCDEWGLSSGIFTRETLRSVLVDFSYLENRHEDEKNDQKLIHIRQSRKDFLESCFRTAKALAADRGTKLLPVIAALGFFIGSFIFALIRTRLADPMAPSTYLNIEAYSISFSAVYFWIISTVILGSAIGSSQTKLAIPRILNRLQRELRGQLGGHVHVIRSIREDEDSANSWEREMDGGVYSWQPTKWTTLRWSKNPFVLSEGLTMIQSQPNDRHRISTMASKSCPPPSSYMSIMARIWSHVKQGLRTLWQHIRPALTPAPGSPTFPFLVVLMPLLCAWLIAMLTPPHGWNIRCVAELVLFSVWILSWVLDNVRLDHYRLRFVQRFMSPKGAFFAFQLTKDIIGTIGTLSIVIITQLGYLNRCSAYTDASGQYVVNPHSQPFADELSNDLKSTFLIIVLVGIFIQVAVVPGVVAWTYFDAWRVFVQRDDEGSYMKMIERWRKPSWPHRATGEQSRQQTAAAGWEASGLDTAKARNSEVIRRAIEG